MKKVSEVFNGFNRNRTICIVVVVIAALYHFISFSFYIDGTLEGRINNHILPAEMWGVPAKLQSYGIQPLYRGPVQTGWDGQFYYYISNDLFARADTPSHIDSPSYRYQRVGMSLYASVVSFVMGHKWVSPTTYFLSYFALVLVATWFCARLLLERGLHPLFTLSWPLSVGTQITMFNALPDAAADAFLILGLAALYAGRFRLAILPLAFSALSREVYVLFPIFIGLMCWVERLSQTRTAGSSYWAAFSASLLQARLYYLAIPVCITVAWHIFVTLRFGVTASSQARGILGAPLAAWWHYFISGIRGVHSVVGATIWAQVEAGMLLLFLLTLIVSAVLSLYVLVARKVQTPLDRGIAVTTLALVLLYACFGPTVAMHYTGYLKAAAVFSFLIPLLLGATTLSVRWRTVSFGVLTAVLLASSIYNWRVRILSGPNFDRYTQMSSVSDTRELSCLPSYEAAIDVRSMEFIEQGGFIGFITGGRRRLIVNLELKNTGSSTLVSTKKGLGSIHMSYHWLDEQGRVWLDGKRSAILKPLQPGESAIVPVITKLPSRSGRYTLRLSPVQEGCTWFYLANKKSAKDINFDFR
jgi:hypothetical protein